MVNKILIRTSDRKTLHKDRRTLGMNGENLQEVLLFCLDEKIEGTGIVEVELPNGEKGMIEVERTEEGYELPVKSSLLTQTGFVKFQLRILHNEVEIFKSEIIALEVKDSINATATIPEEYPSWVDTLTNLKKDLEKAESERVSNENERISAEKTRQENFTKMQKTVENATSNIKDLKEDYNENAKQKTEEFNKNFEEKQKAINDNAEAKTTAFGENAEAQTKTFNTNSDDKLAEYNKNHTAKMKEFDDNYDTKTKTFDDNAAAKVKEYNTNVEQKETELENLAEEKINEYNQVSAELTAKVEQVQAENESLKAENKLIKEQIPSATASGNNIHIEDSSNLDFDWKINGNQYQATREGYQLLNLQSGTQNGITYYVDDEGYFCMSGPCTSDRITLNLNELVLNGTYTFTNKSISGEGINCALKDNTSEYKNIFFTNNKSETKEVNTILKDLVFYLTNGATYNSKIKLMLVSGSQEKDIEPYGASPSPDYPSKVETVGSNVNILENKAISQTLNGVDFLVKEDKSIIVNGTSTDRINFVLSSNNKLKAGTYILSGCPDGGSVTSYHLDVALIGTKTYLIDNGSSNTAKLDNDLDNLTYRILIEKGVTLNSVVFKPKLEKGTVATPYSPYGMGSVEVDVVNSNLLDFNVAQDSRVTVNEDGTLTINGIGGFGLNIDKLQLKAGITYYQKVELISGSGNISGSNINNTFLSFAGAGAWISSENFSQTNLTKDTEKTIIWINATAILNNAVIKIWANTDKSDFVKHQSQTTVMPIQQEMLEGDYIKDVEHHEWKKVVLDGTENWREITTNNLKRFFYEVNVASINDNNSVNCISNYFKGTSRNKLEHSSGDEVSVADRFLNILSKKIETKEDFKAWLKSKYDAGTPIIIYYKQAEAIDLELTSEQKAVREQKLYTYKNITNIAVSNELASIDVNYKKDPTTEHDELQNQIDEIKQLISTTETSALLLDNLQKDVETEVE